jgi:hypothetical protein
MENITYKIDWVIVNENPDRNKQGRYVYIFESDHELTRLLDTIETAVRHGDYTGNRFTGRLRAPIKWIEETCYDDGGFVTYARETCIGNIMFIIENGKIVNQWHDTLLELFTSNAQQS